MQISEKIFWSKKVIFVKIYIWLSFCKHGRDENYSNFTSTTIYHPDQPRKSQTREREKREREREREKKN